MMNPKHLSRGLAVLMLSATLAAPAMAQEATLWSEKFADVCDTDKNGMVTKKEFVDRMAAMWDKHHATMMKKEPGVKAGMMSKAQFMVFAKNLTDPGQIGGS